jgi:hypothetical protein
LTSINARAHARAKMASRSTPGAKEDGVKAMARVLMAIAACASATAIAAENPACRDEPAMRGLRERMTALSDQMDRIERIEDRAEQRRILDLHMKQMREGMRAIRSRDLAPACRVEVMGDMMEVMIRHQAMYEERR